MAWAVAINSTSNEEFPVKALEDQQKSPCCIYYMISKVIFLGLCVKIKYSYQNRMEGVIFRIELLRLRLFPMQGLIAQFYKMSCYLSTLEFPNETRSCNAKFHFMICSLCFYLHVVSGLS